MKGRQKRYILFLRICIVISIMLLLSTVTMNQLLADSTFSVSPKNLPKQDATLTIAYTGEVTGATVTTPDGRTFQATSDGAGTITIYIGDAPAGSYQVTLKGSYINFSVYITGTSPAPPPTQPPQPTPTPMPTPTPIPTPTPTQEPTQAPKPTETRVDPTEAKPTETKILPKPTQSTKNNQPSNAVEADLTPTSSSRRITITPTPTPQATISPTIVAIEATQTPQVTESAVTEDKSKDKQIIPALGIINNQGRPGKNYISGIFIIFILSFGIGLGIGMIVRHNKIKRDYINAKYGNEYMINDETGE